MFQCKILIKKYTTSTCVLLWITHKYLTKTKNVPQIGQKRRKFRCSAIYQSFDRKCIHLALDPSQVFDKDVPQIAQ